MSDAPLPEYNGRHEWFWEPEDENIIYPLDKLVEMYFKSVERNSTLILGVTPDTTGVIPEADTKRMKEFGDEIKRRFSNPIATKKGKGENIHLTFKKPTSINHLNKIQ